MKPLMLDLIMRGWSDGAVMASMDEDHVDDMVYRRGYAAGRNSRSAFQDTVLVTLCEKGLKIMGDDFDAVVDTEYNEGAFVESSERTISELVDATEGRR